jgi:hypothetical protein
MVTVESSFAQTKSSMQSILFDLVCITITASSTSTQLNSAFLAVTTINCKIGADETATTNVKLLDLMKKLGCPDGMCDDHFTNGEKLIQLPNANLSVIILCWALMSEGVQSHGFEGVDTKRRVTAASPYLSDAIFYLSTQMLTSYAIVHLSLLTYQWQYIYPTKFLASLSSKTTD